ncbi:NAD-dependent dehydratase [Photobacterium ganghwense]|uniref:NAD-dependent dehydratase n=1 Tax=Photobacterium ganghwense TaxID=320778 RepID=A0A0J1H8M1_9GAMM|nr:SDR family oxidoreductase [Photobacterium ganghwense]KLV08011.1 NAD-dependent dehydratase [Photobacterium ganghwense]PSU07119.1 NAD-dependent dehydratase [Photobacterium ganghwense]QSV15867.1 SDR family oxidoreductase [Photobacterium ganghwense]
MSNVLVLGASGQIAQWVVKSLNEQTTLNQTLLLRNPQKLVDIASAKAKVVVGDVLDRALLKSAMDGQDIVYANLAGDDLYAQTAAVIDAMQETGVKRLIFVLSLGIYDEIPGKFGEWNDAIIGESLKYYRRAADAIEASGLDYTILRPALLTDEDEVDYEITAKNEAFKGTVVSRKSVGDLITQVILNPATYVGANLGVNKPNTDGDQPYFM